jgi:hypothetical protein
MAVDMCIVDSCDTSAVIVTVETSARVLCERHNQRVRRLGQKHCH